MTKNGYLPKFQLCWSLPEVRWSSGLSNWKNFGRSWVRFPPTAFLRIMGCNGPYFGLWCNDPNVILIPLLVGPLGEHLPRMVKHHFREVFSISCKWPGMIIYWNFRQLISLLETEVTLKVRVILSLICLDLSSCKILVSSS